MSYFKGLQGALSGFGSPGKTIDDLANKYCHVPQDRSNGPASEEGMVFPKDYLNGRINILGILGRPDGNGGVVGPYRQTIIFENIECLFLNNDLRGVGIKIADIESIESNDGSDGNYEFVLVGDIKDMESVKQIVSARVRFKIAEFLSDFFAGDLYLSIGKNALKALRFPTERELDLVRDGIVGAKDIPSQVVKSGPHIVNGVPDNHGEMIGNGRVYIDAQGALTALSVVLSRKHPAFAVIQSAGLSFQVLDVMLGPL